jgi:signal transduction histidine kinase
MGTEAVRRAVRHVAETPAVDVTVALGVAGAMVATVRAATEPEARAADAVAYALGIAMGLVLVARRRYPVGVLMTVSALLLVYYGTGYPGFAPALPLAVPVYTAAREGHLRWAVGVAAAFLGAAVVVVGFRQHSLAGLVSVVSPDAALLAVVILLAEVLRNRQLRLAEAEARLAAVGERHQRESAERIADERLRLAREVHDIMGHSVATIGVHAGLAEEVLDTDPEVARESLIVVRRTAQDAMRELRATVSLLRVGEPVASNGPGADLAPLRGLADLDVLVAPLSAANVDVVLTTAGTPRSLPVVVDQSAYRIVQEALTNVARHADASTARVRLTYGSDDLVVEISDDGSGVREARWPDDETADRGDEDGTGHGLTGMAERVAALGGTLETGNRDDGGFVVRAHLPLGAGS